MRDGDKQTVTEAIKLIRDNLRHAGSADHAYFNGKAVIWVPLDNVESILQALKCIDNIARTSL